MIETLSESGEYEKIDCVVGKFTLDDKAIASRWRAVKKYVRKTYDNLSLSEKVKAKRIMRDSK